MYKVIVSTTSSVRGTDVSTGTRTATASETYSLRELMTTYVDHEREELNGLDLVVVDIGPELTVISYRDDSCSLVGVIAIQVIAQ